jgi:vacuolar-type H+-ATPase subunit F/Vma7
MGRKPDLNGFIPPDVAMFGNRYSIKWQQSARNFRTYAMWWQLFYTAATTSFTWEGLPPEIDTRYLELVLFMNGSIAVTKRVPDADQLPLFVAARFTQQGNGDIYGNPNTIQMTTPNGIQWRRHLNVWVKETANQYARKSEIMQPDAVAIYDNLQRTPLFDAIDLACSRLAEIDLTIDQNMRSQRVPFIINVPEEGKKNAEAMFNKIDSGEPALYLSPLASSSIGIQVFQSGINYVVDKMLNDQLKIVSQVYTLLGIDNNAAAEKKERVQTAETLANNEQFMMQRQSRQRARDLACQRLSEVFGIQAHACWSVPHMPETAEEQNGGMSNADL